MTQEPQNRTIGELADHVELMVAKIAGLVDRKYGDIAAKKALIAAERILLPTVNRLIFGDET